MDIWNRSISLSRLLYGREANIRKTTSFVRYWSLLPGQIWRLYSEEPRASNDIDHYLGSDETRRRNHDIFTTTTPIEEGDDMLYHRELNHITLPDLRRGAASPRADLLRLTFYLCHWTKRNNDITPMFIESYSVSPSLLTDKISIWQQPIDGYDIYSRRNHELPMDGSWGFGQEGDARVPENSMGGHYKGCKTLRVSGKGVSLTLSVSFVTLSV